MNVDDLPSPYGKDPMFRKCFTKYVLLLRKGFHPKTAFRYFYQLHKWPLGLILTSDGPSAGRVVHLTSSMQRKRVREYKEDIAEERRVSQRSLEREVLRACELPAQIFP